MKLEKKRILITGAAGFIGAALARELLKLDLYVTGIDNLNSYYDINLKKSRLDHIKDFSKNNLGSWSFYKIDIANEKSLKKVFIDFRPNIVVHLAAQAGVRYSLINPKAYISSNLVGFCNVLELCKDFNIINFLYASSSSVYGGNKNLPYHENQEVNHPISFYAATKRSNELIAHSYSHLYGLPSTGLRFFTVYGPWGRPDMAPMIFAKSIIDNEPIKIFNHGNMKRDFTYIEDIVKALVKCCSKVASPNKDFDPFLPESSSSFAPHRVFNIGNSQSINLMSFIDLLENAIGKKAKKIFEDIQPGDVQETFANNSSLEKWIGFKPRYSIEEGISEFAKWYIDYYKKF